MDTFIAVAAVVAGPISAVIVALLNNWDKFNKEKRMIKDLLKKSTENEQKIIEIDKKTDVIGADMQKLKNAQRTGLQTQILEKCRRINIAIDKGDVDYSEELKQLIILYKEYHLCGFNCQGKLYFDDTLKRVSEHNNVLVRDLMNTYFADYQP